MGRGRVTLKRIENKINRQVCFSKRRSGLMKKAHEISVLCDADVALIVFSTKGKISEYTSNSSMVRILERYERNTCTERQLNGTNHQSHANWISEHAKLMARIELLQKTHRNFMGEDLDSLSLKELQSLEQQLETALRRLRLRKNQKMLESVSELQKQDKALQNQNRLLLKEIKDMEEELAQPPPVDNQTRENIFPFQWNLRCSGTYEARDNEEIQETQTQNQSLTGLPHWMLQHMSE